MTVSVDDRDFAWCCIATAGFFPILQVFLESLRACIPTATCSVFTVDVTHVPPTLSTLAEFVELPSSLANHRLSDGTLPTLAELAIAAKPLAIASMLRAGHRHVIYADADLWMLSRPVSLMAMLRDAEIVLSPHIVLLPSQSRRLDLERVVLGAGAINAGLVGVTAGEVAQRFCAWWAERTFSFSDRPRGAASDQRWLTLVPYLFPNVVALTDPGVNVGHWSIDRTDDVGEVNGEFTLCGHPISLLHMSGFAYGNPAQLSRFRPLFTPPCGSVLRRLTERYDELLRQARALARTAAPREVVPRQ